MRLARRMLSSCIAAVLGTCAVSALLVAEPAIAADRASSRVVLSPPAGAKLPARPADLLIRAASGDSVVASLNGVSIGHRFSAARDGVRRLKASPNYGLRPGNNVLHVTVRSPDAHARHATVRFAVAADEPLAAAGVDRVAPLGGEVLLDADASRTGDGDLAGAAARYRWTVVEAPAHSALLDPDRANDRIDALDSARPAIRPDLPGHYLVRVTVTEPDGRSGSDLVALDIDPAPLLAVDTMAKDPKTGKPGIRVGDTVYPANRGSWLQLVVLDRSLGTLRDNRSFPCRDVSGTNWLRCTPAVQNYLKDLDPSALVIASNQPEGGGTSAAPKGAALALAALTPPDVQNFPDDLVRGTYSAIGSPHNQDKSTVAHAASTNVAGAGAITGYLVRNNRLNYSYASPDRVPFNTQAPGSDTGQNVIQVGNTKFTETGAGSTPGGFQVVVVDRGTLQGTSTWFATGQATGPNALSTISAMRDALKQADEDGDKLVFVASRGNPTVAIDAYRNLPTSHEFFHAVRDLVSTIESVGGTRHRAFSVIDNDFYDHNSYTLAGASGLGAGFGEETLGQSAGTGPGSTNTLPLDGVLTRDTAEYGFDYGTTENAPVGTPPDGPNQSETLISAIYQPPTPWPDAGNPGLQAAIAYLGTQALGTTNPRGLYWTQSWKDVDAATIFWEQASTRIQDVPEKPLPAKVTRANVKIAKQMLGQEIGWLEAEHAYLGTLAAPYAKTQLTSWADLKSIADTINKDVKASSATRTEQNVNDVFDLVRGLTEAIPAKPGKIVEIGKIFEVANRIYDFAFDLADTASGDSAGEPFSSSVANAGKDLADRLDSAQSMLTDRFANVIAADYGKLKRVGTCGALDPACPDPLKDWQLTNDQLTNIGAGVRAGLKTSFYSTLLPAKFTLWSIPVHNTYQDARHWVGHGVLDVGSFYPFDSSTDLGQFARLDCRDMGDHHNDEWEVQALGLRSGDGNVDKPWTMQTPDSQTTDGVFGAPNPDTFPDGGGLGNDREQFFDRYFAPETIDHFPLTDSLTGWDNPPFFEGACRLP